MCKRYIFVALISLFFIAVACAPQAPTPDPVAAQVAMALAVQGTLTALAPTVTMTPALTVTPPAMPTPTQTPMPTIAPRPTSTQRPTVDRAVQQFAADLRSIMADEQVIIDDWNVWTSGRTLPSSLDEMPAYVAGQVAKLQEFRDRIGELLTRVNQLVAPRSCRAVRDKYYDCLSRWQRSAQLSSDCMTTLNSALCYQADAEMENVNTCRRSVNDDLRDIDTWLAGQ